MPNDARDFQKLTSNLINISNDFLGMTDCVKCTVAIALVYFIIQYVIK